MPFLDAMHQYFRGERLEAWFFILPAGLALLGFGVTALKAERGDFAWGTATPAIVFGLLLSVAGLVVGLRTTDQVNAIEARFNESPALLVEAELLRMQRVNTNFRTTFYAFGGFAALGLLLHYTIAAGWSRGLGGVLVLLGGLGLLIDAFAERRAVPYTAALEVLAARVARDHR